MLFQETMRNIILLAITTCVVFDLSNATIKKERFKRYCGKNVSYNNAQPFKVSSCDTKAECGFQCLQNINCEMFVYKGGSNLHNCEMFDVRPPCAYMTFRNGSAVYHKEIKCSVGKIAVGPQCVCLPGTYGDTCQNRYRDCSDYFSTGWPGPKNQVLNIWPDNYPEAFEVVCDLNFRGYTVLQSNRNSSACPIPYADGFFNKSWENFRKGFGEINGSCQFWLGLEKIHHLTTQATYTMQIVLNSPGNPQGYPYIIGFYRKTWVDSEANKYRLHIDGSFFNHKYPTGDSLLNPLNSKETVNGQMFSTYDRDNDNSASNCAEEFQAGFWFNDCAAANPNGWVRATADGLRDTSVPSILWKHNWGARAITRFSIKMRKD